MTEPTSSSPDEFDRIVEGLDLDLSGLDDFDAAAARAATEHEARLEELRQRAAALDEDTDEQSYRDVGPADLHVDRRVLTAWAVVIGGPCLLLLVMASSVRFPPLVLSGVIGAAVAGVVYLIARLPDRGPSSPDWPDDGAAL